MHQTVPSLADFEWLVDAPGRSWLQRLREDSASVAIWSKRLRKELSAARAHLLLEQHDLRKRAARRFPLASQLFFTDVGLQQATDPITAAYKGSRFENRVPVLDLCCGIGGDLTQLAARGAVEGVDQDPLHVLLARANLNTLDRRQGRVACGDVTQLSAMPGVALHCDPDRRPQGRRSIQVSHHQPSLDQLPLTDAWESGAAIKLAPATTIDALTSSIAHSDCEWEWTGWGRECQQLIVWLGPLARHPGRRVATQLMAEGPAIHWVSEANPLPGRQRMAAEAQRFILEPAASVLAAGLTDELAAQYGLAALTAGGGYLTGDEPLLSPWLQGFEVLAAMPFREPRIRAWLRQHGVGHVEVKQRGAGIDCATLQRRLSAVGSDQATVLIYQQGHKKQAVIARRIAPSAHDVSLLP